MAKGLGFALEKPIIPVPTLEGMAYNFYGTDKVVCPLLDARRNQVYTGLYEFVKKAEKEVYEIAIIKDQCAVSIEEILENCNALKREVMFLGDGVPVFQETIREKCGVPYSFVPAHMNRQRAASVAALAAKYYERGETRAAAEYVPEYLRLSQAERERLKRREGNGVT